MVLGTPSTTTAAAIQLRVSHTCSLVTACTMSVTRIHRSVGCIQASHARRPPSLKYFCVDCLPTAYNVINGGLPEWSNGHVLKT
jgi:hypothetical protein